MTIAPDAYLHVTGSQIMMVCQIYMLRLLHDVGTIFTILSYELGTILCLIVTVNMELYYRNYCSQICFLISFVWVFIAFLGLSVDIKFLSFFPCPHISCVYLLHKFVVLLQFAAVSSS